jgi:hypothetical protein
MSDSTEVIARFRRGPEVLGAALEGVGEEESKFSPAPGKWTIREIAQHLADTEIVAGMRLRQMVAENKPTLAVFDQDAWAKGLGYEKCDPVRALEQFRTVRAINSDMLAGLPAEAFGRESVHPERGVLTVRDWVIRFSAHVDTHAQQIQSIREAWASRHTAHA